MIIKKVNNADNHIYKSDQKLLARNIGLTHRRLKRLAPAPGPGVDGRPGATALQLQLLPLAHLNNRGFTMILILDGSSENDSHVGSEKDNLI